jgi:hypothetical protein
MTTQNQHIHVSHWLVYDTWLIPAEFSNHSATSYKTKSEMYIDFCKFSIYQSNNWKFQQFDDNKSGQAYDINGN